MGLYEGLYAMWYPYYHPIIQYPVYNPATPPFQQYYPYYNPWTPAYVNSINALRARVAAGAVLDYYRNGVDINRIYGKILEGRSKALLDQASKLVAKK